VSRARLLNDLTPPLLLIGSVVVVWQLVAMSSGISPLVLPTPIQIAQAGWETRAQLATAIGYTMLETVLGLSISILIGIFIAALMDFFRPVRRALYPILVVSQTVQILAIAPLLVIWFGFGLLPKVLIVILICFFPMTVSTADGLASAEPEQIALLRSMGASRAQIWRIVRLPAALPSFFSGLRIAVTYSVVGATIGEWVGGANGLGVYLLRSKNALATDQVFAAMLITSLLSIGLFILVLLIERIVIPWHVSAQRKASWDELGIY
jgi:ABC-type nitrate/sulfonate/bicarbonate transport system permease component